MSDVGTNHKVARKGDVPHWNISPDDTDFMSDSSAAIIEERHTGGRLILWGAVLFFIFAAAWSNVAELDEVTRGTGKVIPSRQIQVVQNLEGGIVSEILVSEGDVVDKGDILLRVKDSFSASEYQESRLYFLALKAKASRLRSEAEGKPCDPPKEVMLEAPELVKQESMLFLTRQKELHTTLGILTQQISQRKQEMTELRAKQEQLNRSYQLVNRELKMTKPLVKEGAISEVELLRLERQVNDIKGDMEATELAIPRVRSKYTESKRKKEEMVLSFRNAARAELNDTLAAMRRISKSNQALGDRVSRKNVRSPLRGTVNKIHVNTVGGVIQPGMDLVEIVPLDDALIIETQIRPADIAFLHTGQKAIVKLSAYNYAKYGGLEGKVEHISADTITDERGGSFYLVRVRTERSYVGQEQDNLPILPGMMTTVDILTGKKTVLEYLLKPVLRLKDQALHER